MSTFKIENPGYCHCCRRSTTFRSTEDWLRDFYFCKHCQSIPRHRHMQAVLDLFFAGWEERELHEASPSNTFISRLARRYTSSQYFDGVPRGAMQQGVRCENIEALTFGDAAFDLFITQDVLEHVFHPDRAVREIHRVLKPGGAHVFTAPKHRSLAATRQRAALGAQGDVHHLLPPEYHGNPVGDGRALVTWDYGQDFELLLSEWAGVSVETVQTRNRSKGLDGEFNEVYVIRKI